MTNSILEKFKLFIKSQSQPNVLHNPAINETFTGVPKVNEAEKDPLPNALLALDDRELIPALQQPKSLSIPTYKPRLPTAQFFHISEGSESRRIAYALSGNECALNVLLCLPGLLETKAAFAVLHAYFLNFNECQVVSIDYPGRGESDLLPDICPYTMSLYLADIVKLIDAIIFKDGNKNVRLTILGTSMGGVLAMYLAQRYQRKVYEVILNDIALTVNWTSLYSLYKSMKDEVGYKHVRDLANELSVNERVIGDVQLPGHFDLSYKADIWGMNFYDSLSQYKGKVSLIYGSESQICTRQRVIEAEALIPKLITYKVDGAAHPAPFNLKVCEFIQKEMQIRA